MEKEIQDISREISRMQREDAMEQELNKPINTPLTSKPFKGEIGGTGRASEEYRKAMLGALRSNFADVSNVLREGSDADGGYLVPEEYDKRIMLDSYLISHLIDPELLKTDDFDMFILDRAKKILDAIQNATGKIITGRDSEEVIEQFGDKLI